VHKLWLASQSASRPAWLVPGDLASQSSDYQINFTLTASMNTSLYKQPHHPSPQHTSDNRYTRRLHATSYTLNNTSTLTHEPTSLQIANMAEVASKPTEPVPLDTIPISPEGAEKEEATTNGSSGKVVTVFDDPNNFTVKHALQNTWTLWFTKPPSGKQDWNELLKEVISFDSVEEFWGIYVCSVTSMLSQCITLLTALFSEQHHLCVRARAEVRLPPLQARCPP
jgi:hypothetical protein